MSHMQSCAAGLVTAAIALSGLATQITDHWTGWDVVQRPASGVTVRWIIDRSWYKYCGIRCFSCDDQFILGNKAFCLFFSREKLKGNCRGTVLAGFMSYRCRSALGVQSGTGAFEARGLYRETVISHTGRARLSTVSSENWISIPWD